MSETSAEQGDDLVLVAVADLKEGDLVDMQQDRYADPLGDHPEYEFEYGLVDTIERETSDCIRVDFSNGPSVGFPFVHQIYRVNTRELS